MNETLAVFFGFALRIIAPIAATVFLAYFLRRLDARWQEEARREVPVLNREQTPCWEMKGCSLEEMSRCPATKSNQPCWQTFRSDNGYLKDACLECPVFASAPAPAHVTAR